MPVKKAPAKQQAGGTFRLTPENRKPAKESLPASARFVSDAVRSDKVVSEVKPEQDIVHHNSKQGVCLVNTTAYTV